MATSKPASLEVRPTRAGLFEVHYTGGGRTPDELKGLYTGKLEAERAISHYQSKVRAKVGK